jgi:hypothetical protein
MKGILWGVGETQPALPGVSGAREGIACGGMTPVGDPGQKIDKRGHVAANRCG